MEARLTSKSESVAEVIKSKRASINELMQKKDWEGPTFYNIYIPNKTELTTTPKRKIALCKIAYELSLSEILNGTKVIHEEFEKAYAAVTSEYKSLGDVKKNLPLIKAKLNDVVSQSDFKMDVFTSILKQPDRQDKFSPQWEVFVNYANSNVELFSKFLKEEDDNLRNALKKVDEFKEKIRKTGEDIANPKNEKNLPGLRKTLQEQSGDLQKWEAKVADRRNNLLNIQKCIAYAGEFSLWLEAFYMQGCLEIRRKQIQNAIKNCDDKREAAQYTFIVLKDGKKKDFLEYKGDAPTKELVLTLSPSSKKAIQEISDIDADESLPVIMSLLSIVKRKSIDVATINAITDGITQIDKVNDLQCYSKFEMARKLILGDGIDGLMKIYTESLPQLVASLACIQIEEQLVPYLKELVLWLDGIKYRTYLNKDTLPEKVNDMLKGKGLDKYEISDSYHKAALAIEKLLTEFQVKQRESAEKNANQQGADTVPVSVAATVAPLREDLIVAPVDAVSQSGTNVAGTVAPSASISKSDGAIKMPVSDSGVVAPTNPSEAVSDVVATGFPQALPGLAETADFEISTISFTEQYFLERLQITDEDIRNIKISKNTLTEISEEIDLLKLQKLQNAMNYLQNNGFDLLRTQQDEMSYLRGEVLNQYNSYKKNTWTKYIEEKYPNLKLDRTHLEIANDTVETIRDESDAKKILIKLFNDRDKLLKDKGLGLITGIRKWFAPSSVDQLQQKVNKMLLDAYLHLCTIKPTVVNETQLRGKQSLRASDSFNESERQLRHVGIFAHTPTNDRSPVTRVDRSLLTSSR